MDRIKFAKLMMLTTSEFDGEALSALRKAQGMLLTSGLNWETFIVGLPLYAEREKPKPQGGRDWTEVEEMLGACLDGVTGGGRDFIESLDAQFSTKGWLSDKQVYALRKFYNSLRR